MATAPHAKYRKDYQAPDFTITHIDLDVTLDPIQTIVVATSTVKQQKTGATSLFLNGEQLNLQRVEIDGKTWPHVEQTATGLTLTQLPADFTLLIETHINPSQNSAFEGLYLSNGAFCTQCEAEGFRKITYYLDRPDVLAVFRTKITADKAAYPYLLSNGNKMAAGDLDGNRHFALWEDPYAKPCYLFALVAGDFDCARDSFVTRSGREVALEIFVDKGNLNRTAHAMASLKHAMAWDEKRFSLEYDLDIYMIVAVDFFNMGAMENKGLNIFNSKYVLADPASATDTDYDGIEAVIGHEYFHNWTGNRVTCRDWFQLSLKEGLTVFRDQEFSSDLGSRAVNRIKNARIIRGPQFAEDAGPMAHPIRPEKVIEMNNFYTLTVYEKGSEVIRMIHTLLGESAFMQGMALYFERHDGTAATCDDFVAAMQDASGIDLGQFKLWYSQSGTPELSVTSTYDKAQHQLHLQVKQTTPPTLDQAEKQPLLIPLDIELYDQQGQVIALQTKGKAHSSVLLVSDAEQEFIFDGVMEQPVIALLREFSAPVKLNYPYSDHELAFLMRHSRNDFAKWDAGQMLLAKYIKQYVGLATEKNNDSVTFSLPEAVIDAFRATVLDPALDPAFIAQMLTLPTENEIGGWFEQMDVDAIYLVRQQLKKQIATELEDEFSALYATLKQQDYTIAHQALAKRSLRNTCLAYLALTEHGQARVEQHYYHANNMTDTMAALSSATDAKLACRAQLMQDFSDKWQHDGLVMDKWFMLQAINPQPDVLDIVKQQLNHPAFSLKNPNRIRALIGSFCQHNPVHFHRKDGQGYAFLTQILTTLNHTNPQVASRLIDPLLKLKQVDAARAQMMRTELETLARLDGLAQDLYEKIEKALS